MGWAGVGSPPASGIPQGSVQASAQDGNLPHPAWPTPTSLAVPGCCPCCPLGRGLPSATGPSGFLALLLQLLRLRLSRFHFSVSVGLVLVLPSVSGSLCL